MEYWMEYWRGDERPYRALILAVRITLPHFSVSSAMNFPNSAGPIALLRQRSILDSSVFSIGDDNPSVVDPDLTKGAIALKNGIFPELERTFFYLVTANKLAYRL